MPETLVPPEITDATYAEHYAKQWATVLHGDPNDPETVTDDPYGYRYVSNEERTVLETVRFKAVGWGQCGICNNPSDLHVATFTTNNNIDCVLTDDGPQPVSMQIINGRCKDCARKHIVAHLVYRWYSLVIRRYSDEPYSLILPDWMFNAQDTQREICLACQAPVLESGDTLITNYYATHRYMRQDAMTASGITAPLHLSCTTKCNDCQEYYYGISSWAGNYRRNLHHIVMDVYDGEAICQSCLDVQKASAIEDGIELEKCDGCGSWSRESNVWSDYRNQSLCESCFDSSFDCGDCGYERYENEDHYCDNDDDGDGSGWIHNYTYKPSPIFFGDSNIHMGIELEVEASQRKGNRDEGCNLVMNHDERGRRMYLKSDGSLSYGFEIVTHPHTLDEYHNLDWSFLAELQEMSFRSWNAGSCGLHVHISLTAFVNEAHQIRFTKFIYDNQRQVCRIAGRRSNYATFDAKGNVVKKIKNKNQDTNRYSAVNVQNEHTLEVRVFKGSLRIERVLSGIEFVHAVAEYTRSLKVAAKDKPFSWARFVSFVTANVNNYPNLFIIINETFERDNTPEDNEGEND